MNNPVYGYPDPAREHQISLEDVARLVELARRLENVSVQGLLLDWGSAGVSSLYTDPTLWARVRTAGAAGSVPAYGTSATGTASGGTVSVSTPSSGAANDLLIAVVGQAANAAAAATPAGWTAGPTKNATAASLSVFYRFHAGSAEPSSYSFAPSSGTPAISVTVYRLTGAGTPEDSSSNSGSGLTLTATGLTTRAANRLMVAAFSNGSSTKSTPQSPLTDRSGVGANNVGVAAGTASQASAGATGDVTATQSGSVGWAAALLSVPPSAVAHAWDEVYPTPNGDWVILPGGRSGTTSNNPLYEASTGGPLLAGAVLRAWPGLGQYYEGIPGPNSSASTPPALTVDTENNGAGDTTFSDAACTVIHVDQGSGLRWASGDHLSAQDASDAHKGVLSLGDQTVAGGKFATANGTYGWGFADSAGTIGTGPQWVGNGVALGDINGVALTGVDARWRSAPATLNRKPIVRAGGWAVEGGWVFEDHYEAAALGDPGFRVRLGTGAALDYVSGAFLFSAYGGFYSDDWLVLYGHCYAAMGFSTDNGSGTKVDGSSGSFVVGGVTYTYRNGIIISP